MRFLGWGWLCVWGLFMVTICWSIVHSLGPPPGPSWELTVQSPRGQYHAELRGPVYGDQIDRCVNGLWENIKKDSELPLPSTPPPLPQPALVAQPLPIPNPTLTELRSAWRWTISEQQWNLEPEWTKDEKGEEFVNPANLLARVRLLEAAEEGRRGRRPRGHAAEHGSRRTRRPERASG